MKKNKIYISMVDAYYHANPSFVEYFKNRGFEVAFRLESAPIEEDKLIALFADCDICIANAKPVNKKMIESAPNLKLIAVFGAGYNQIDVDTASERGIYVTNARGGNSRAVAEHTFAMFLALARRMVYDDNEIRHRQWKNPMGHEIYGKTLGVIGFGAIGKEVAKIAQSGFYMNVCVYDPYINENSIKEHGASSTDLKKLMSDSDFISVHIPLTDATKYMIDEEMLALMKKSAYIVNMSRGGVIKEDALYEALLANSIAGAGLDVHENEPIREGNPSKFEGFSNVILTSHSGASSIEAVKKIGNIIIDNVEDVIAGNKPRHNIVNSFLK